MHSNPYHSITLGALRTNSDGTMFIHERPIHLSMPQRLLLRALIAADGRPVSREALFFYTMRSPQTSHTSRSLDIAISRLRRSLGTEGWRVRSVRNAGYLLDRGATPSNH